MINCDLLSIVEINQEKNDLIALAERQQITNSTYLRTLLRNTI